MWLQIDNVGAGRGAWYCLYVSYWNVKILEHSRVPREILFTKFRDTAMQSELLVCCHVFLYDVQTKKCHFYDRKYYMIRHKKTPDDIQ